MRLLPTALLALLLLRPDWATPPRAAWWVTPTLARVEGNAGAHCAEGGVCIAWGQGFAFSIEGAGPRVALPMVGG